MKKIYSSALVIFLLVSVFTQESVVRGQIFEDNQPRVGQKFLPGEFLAKFKPSVSEQTIDALNATHGVSTIYVSPYAGFRRLSTPEGGTVADMVDIYQANSNVEYAEANYIAYAMKAPNDEFYSRQWNMHNSSNGGINVESAWSISTGLGAVVAILDTGIAYENYSEKNPDGSNTIYQQAPDLASTLFVPGFDFVNNDEHPNDDSVSSHGTHIAGTIAQNTNNGIGTVGVAFDSYLMPVKVLNSLGLGTYADIADGIIWATDNGAHVINLGLGGNEPSTALEEAIAYSYNRGVTLIAAVGNDGIGGVSYPAAYDDYVIAVGATRYDETLAYYSNFGLNLDLVAPGGDLNIDQNGDDFGDGILQQTFKTDGFGAISWGYGFMEGTSMAAAHVSGVAALLISNGNAVSPAEVRQALESTAEDKDIAGWDIRYGWGIVDAFAALQWTTSNTGPGPGPAPKPPGPEPLKAEFTAEPTTAPDQTTIQFINQSTGNITSWLWDFGDGATSIDPNPSHLYEDARTYTVSLTVSGPDGSDTETKERFIKLFIPEIPNADFTREPISINSPLTVQFIDESTAPATLINLTNGTLFFSSIESASLGGITTWTWDFGDGTTSNDRNPSHTYQQAGTFTVSLTVVGPGGSDTETKKGFIQLDEPSAPIADFSAKPRSGNGPLVVQFTDASTGHISSRLWDFGDGTTSTEQNPIHTYIFEENGDFTVSLSVTGLGGTDTETKGKFIHLNTPPLRVNIGMSKNAVFREWHEVTANLIVTHNDPTGLPVAGANVEGTWSGGYNGTVSGVTNASGGISFGTPWVAGGSTVTFTINRVTIGGKELDFAGTRSASIGI
ncbi:MAG: S8 family serine peptidase [Planctomycetes bacterium]|nr:S8 family serine peptidase [Planctomycetota bacterium]